MGLVLGVLLLAAGVRLYGVLQAHLWWDEFWMLEVANGHGTLHEKLPANVLIDKPPALTAVAQARPWWSIWTTLDQEPHPPLFYILLRWWRELVGPTEMAARLLPLLASVACVLLMYRLVLLLHGPWPAFWAMLILSLGPQQIYFAQELRSYSFLLALGLAACCLLIAIERYGPDVKRLVGLGAVVLCLFLTHYLSVGSLVGLAVYAALRLPRKTLRRVAITFAIAVLVFGLIWGPFLLQQHKTHTAQGVSEAFLADRGAGYVGREMLRLATIPAQALCVNTLWVHPPAWLIVIVLGGFLAPLIWLRRDRSGALLLWYLWFAGTLLPMVAGDLLNHFRTLAFARYTLSAEVAVAGVMAAIATLRGSSSDESRDGSRRLAVRFAAPVLAALIAAMSLPAALTEVAAKPDWQPMIDQLRHTAGDGQPIIYAAENRAGSIVYLFASHYLDPSEHHPALILTLPLTPDLQHQLRASGGQWIVFTGQRQTLEALLPNASLDVIAGVDNYEGFMGGICARIIWKNTAAPFDRPASRPFN